MTEPALAPEPKKKASASASARQAEAQDGYVTVEQCGVELRIPIGTKVPIRATLRFMGLNDDLSKLGPDENANLMGTVLQLGAEQWEAFLAANPNGDDFNAVVARVTELSGN